jgi:DNA-binding response OmpR family regulator
MLSYDGQDALRAYKENQHKIQLLLLDVIIPKKDGKEIYDTIKKEKPDLKVIFMSGYDPNVIHKRGVIEQGLEFISKPVIPDNLLRKVRDVLDNCNTNQRESV